MSLTLIFGGSFNPPHLAHTLALCAARAMLEPARMLVVPTFQHPFAKALAAYEDRVHMCELAFGWIPGVEISRVEQSLGGESRTLRTLEHLQMEHPAWSMRLLVGADILGEAHKWFGWEKIVQIAPPFVLGRQGFSEAAAPKSLLPELSSTEVRSRALRGEDISELVAKSVAKYIQEHGLYQKDLQREAQEQP